MIHTTDYITTASVKTCLPLFIHEKSSKQKKWSGSKNIFLHFFTIFMHISGEKQYYPIQYNKGKHFCRKIYHPLSHLHRGLIKIFGQWAKKRGDQPQK